MERWPAACRLPAPAAGSCICLTIPLAHPPPPLRSLKPPRTLPGRGRDLRLLVVLDTTRNAIALQEAAQRGIPTVALASGQVDMSSVTYPVLARDFSPDFVHFFLDLLVRVANVPPGAGAGGGGEAGGV